MTVMEKDFITTGAVASGHLAQDDAKNSDKYRDFIFVRKKSANSAHNLKFFVAGRELTGIHIVCAQTATFDWS